LLFFETYIILDKNENKCTHNEDAVDGVDSFVYRIDSSLYSFRSISCKAANKSDVSFFGHLQQLQRFAITQLNVAFNLNKYFSSIIWYASPCLECQLFTII
jgi:hypothetical protein